MAFDKEDLVRVGGQPQAQSMFSYKSDDIPNVILSSAYFNSAIGVLRAGDYIFVLANGAHLLLTVASDLLPITTNNLADLPVVNQATGWATYTDTQYISLGTALSLTTDTDTILPNNSGSKIESQMPSDITAFYDGSVITGRNGDNLDIMIYFTAVPSAVNQYVEVWLDIGGTVGELYRQTFTFPKGVGVERGILYSVSSAYTLDTWEANGATVYARSNAQCSVYKINFNLDRSHKAR